MKATIAALVAALAVVATSANASAAIAVSSNWSGYAITGTTFSSVSGSWVQPTATCTSPTSGTTASAFWVGLGGDTGSTSALEQTGTEADCSADGTVRYSAWYELVPAASVKVGLRVSAGDGISASIKISGTSVTLGLTDLTTGKSFTRTLTMASPDTSSAEWIAEAPSTLTPGGTSVLALTDFGTVRFSNASATSTSGHTGSVSDSAWKATRIRLLSSSGGGPGGPFGPFAAYDGAATEAVPSALTPAGRAFSVTWRAIAAAAQPVGA